MFNLKNKRFRLINKAVILIFALLSSFSFLNYSCGDSGKDPIRFKIVDTANTSSGNADTGNFNGYYYVDLGIEVPFSVTLTAGYSISSYNSLEIDDIENLVVSATRIYKGDTLTISIIRNNKIVKEGKLEAQPDASSPTMTIQLSYNYGEEESTTTSSTTSTSSNSTSTSTRQY